MAFAPDYERSGRFYVDYTDAEGDSRIVEFQRSEPDPDVADPGSARELLFVDQPFANHNGGQLQFGPDGLLYIGLGDGGGGDDPMRNGQSLDTLLGKILRIDPRRAGEEPYSVPRSNPFAGDPDAMPEIYSYGLRNPWRFSFDRETGSLSIGDVGHSAIEEVDLVHAARARARTSAGRRSRERAIRPRPGGARPRPTGARVPARGRSVRRHGRRTSCETRICARSTGATSTPISASGSCAASPPGRAGRRATTAPSGSRSRS